MIKGLAPQPDPQMAPSPSGGWSETITELNNATVVTSNGRGLTQVCGVYHEDGAYCHEAVLWRGRPLMLEDQDVPQATETLGGNWLWGGVLLHHFGHFLTESMCRIWAHPNVKDQIDGILFIHKRNGPVTEFHKRFMELCDVHVPIKVVYEPTKVETLFVPGQGFGLGNISFGTSSHNQFLKDNFAKDIAPEGAERVYISRSALRAAKGGAIGETEIEHNLEQDGYSIYHPQNHSIEHQIAQYKAAKQIIALDGSALHLAGFCIDPSTDVAMIKRRSHSAPINIAKQLYGFTGKPIHVVDEIEFDWIVAGRGRADRYSIGQIDFKQLGHTLYKIGMLRSEPDWPDVKAELVNEEIAELSRATRNTYEKVMSKRTFEKVRMIRQERRLARSNK